jgi:hypothetical protein
MRRAGPAAAALLLTLSVGACAGMAPPAPPAPSEAACAGGPSIERARAILADVGVTGDLAGEAHEGDATVYIFRPVTGAARGRSFTVLLEGCDGATYVEGRLLRADVPATVTRVGARSGGADGDMDIQPGYLVGVVRDERVDTIEMWWPMPDAPNASADPSVGGTWVTPVPTGPFINAVSPDVPLDAFAGYRALDENDEVIAEIGEH